MLPECGAKGQVTVHVTVHATVHVALAVHAELTVH